MPQCGEGNGCENGKRSHRNGGLRGVLGFRAMWLMLSVSGKGAVLTVLGPWAATRYSPRAAFHRDALVLHSLESSQGTTTPIQPSIDLLNHRVIRDPGEPTRLHFQSAFFV